MKITMKIAVASQNRKEITGHTGRCRKFWIYKIENDAIAAKELLELPKEQSFHETSPFEPSPLDNVQVGNRVDSAITREKHPCLDY